MRTLNKSTILGLLLIFRATFSWADMHEIKIDEVMAGLNGDANIQFIELKLLATDQKCQGTGNIIDFTNHLCDGSGPGAKLVFFNAQGSQTAEFIFPGNTPLGDAGRSILIATKAFASLPTVPQPDFIMPANIVPNSGKLCYRNQDGAPFGVNVCLAYGNFTGSNPESFGIAPSLPINGAQSLRRVSDSFNNAIDFALGDPAPRNNSGNCGTVTGGNSCPVANSQSVTTLEDTPIKFTLTGSDPDGSPLIFSIVTFPRSGSLTGTIPNLTYTPVQNFNGFDSFTFKVNDGSFDSNTATVSISITAADDPPVANNRFVTTVENTPVNIFLSGFDPDATFANLTFSIVTFPANGSLSGTLPNVIYTPNLNFRGPDNFTFKVNDGLFDSGPATVSIEVLANLAPTAHGQNLSTAFGTPLSIFLTGSDPEFAPLTFSVVTSPINGSLSGNPPNVIYTPNSNFSGPDSFTFKVNDGRLDSLPATISITVRIPCSTEPIAFGETKNGTLTNTDCIAPHRIGSFADLYIFAGNAGQQVRITMNSTTFFDTFLALQDPFGNLLASNDDCNGAGLNSCLPINALSSGSITLPFTGTYSIEATSLVGGATGSYAVTLSLANAPAPPVLTIAKAGTGRGTVTDGTGGINCGSDCSEPFGNGASVSLNASSDAGSTFDGWSSGPCFGIGACFFNIFSNTTVTANFSALPIIIGAGLLPEGEVNVPYSADLIISGGIPPYTFQFLKGALPAGLTLNPQGHITGSPSSNRRANFTLQVRDQNNVTASKSLSIVLFKVLTIASNSLKAAKVGVAYSTTLKAKGGKPPFSWSVVPDSFPAWLNFDPTTGQLSGTPPGPGTFPITFQLTDAMGGQAQKTLSLVVK